MENDTPQPSSPSLSPPDTTAPVPPAAPDAPEPPEPEVKKDDGAPKKSGGMKMVMMLVLALIVAAAAGYGGYAMSKSKADKKEAELNAKIATLQNNDHEVPADAIKVSACIPNMGYHYIAKGADPEYGPFYLVNEKKQVIGLEYMASDDMLTGIPNTTPKVSVVLKDTPMYGWKFDHGEVSKAPEGHEGLLRSHIDVHMYLVSSADQKNACVK